MRQCPFYRIQPVRRANKPEGPFWPVRWCSHSHSPVKLLIATETIGQIGKLKCGGDPEKCEIPPDLRPPLWLIS